MICVGKIKQYTNVLVKPLAKGKQEVSLSAFSFVFSDLVQYSQTQVDNIPELERRNTGGKPACWESYPSCTAQCRRSCSERLLIRLKKALNTKMSA